MEVIIGIVVCLAVATVAVLGWIDGARAAAVFLTLVWLLAIGFAVSWLTAVPLGHETKTWVVFLMVACGSFVVIWMPNRLRARP